MFESQSYNIIIKELRSYLFFLFRIHTKTIICFQTKFCQIYQILINRIKISYVINIYFILRNYGISIYEHSLAHGNPPGMV